MGDYISSHGGAMWVRHVLVPGLTDDDEGLKALKTKLDQWGDCVERAAENAMALEAAAEIAIKMKSIDSEVSEIEAFLLEQRYMKKHGKRTNRNSRK